MPHVSSQKVKKKIYKKINDNFLDIFSHVKSKAETAKLMAEILTQTERIMVAKRVAIILMLQKGYSFRIIQKTLKVTPQTVLRFWKKYKNGSFSSLKIVKKDVGSFWKDLEWILQAGMPPRGRGRWKQVFQRLDKE